MKLAPRPRTLSLAGAAISAALAVTACGAGTKATATASFPGAGVFLAIERSNVSSPAGVERRVLLYRGKRDPVSFAFPADPKGNGRVNLYGVPAKLLYLRDGAETWTLDTESGAWTESGCPDCLCANGAFLGAFDRDDRGVWRFVPAKERPELPVPAEGT